MKNMIKELEEKKLLDYGFVSVKEYNGITVSTEPNAPSDVNTINIYVYKILPNLEVYGHFIFMENKLCFSAQMTIDKIHRGKFGAIYTDTIEIEHIINNVLYRYIEAKTDWLNKI